MILFADTSAFVKLFVHESGSRSVAEYAQEAELVVVAQVSYVEGCAALARAYKSYQRLTQAQFDQALRAFQRWFDEVTIVPASEIVFTSAARCAVEYGLRAYDAIQLASVLTIRDLHPTFLAADKELLQAAEIAQLCIASV